MIRSELLQALAKDNPELRLEEVEQVLDIFFDEIAARLAEGGRVELRGFGAFSTRERDARTGRNPRSGDSASVPAKRVPYFSKALASRFRQRAAAFVCRQDSSPAAGLILLAGSRTTHGENSRRPACGENNGRF